MVFMGLMNRVLKDYLDSFVIMFIDDTYIYSKDENENEIHLSLDLKVPKEHKLYVKFKVSLFFFSLLSPVGV